MTAARLTPMLACLLLLAPSLHAADLFPADRPVEEAIDHYVDLRLQRENVIPAPLAEAAVLARRTTLDLAGRIPTVQEAQAFVNSNEPDKRPKLVDRHLAAPAFARHQSNAFDAELMLGSGASLREYFLQSVQEGRPWDVMFREMLLGVEEDKEQKGAIQYIRSRAKDLDKLTNRVSVDFFGVNVSCAKCHDHPLAPEWTQAHFYGMKSFFSRTFENGGFVGEREYGRVSYKTVEGEQKDAQLMFLTGNVVDEPESKEPDGAAKKKEKKLLDELKKKKRPPPPPAFSRRARLVETALGEGERDYFAKSIVNRLWNRLIGRGLVTPIDQMHPENPPSHPELLDWLARDLVAHKYDLKRLIRGVVLSDTYARSSAWQSEEKRPSEELFAIGFVRPLAPHQYATSLKLASYQPDHFNAEQGEESLAKRIEQIEQAARGFAGQIEHPAADFQISVDEALLFSNNERIKNEFLRDSGDSLVGLLRKTEDDKQLIDLLVWSVFSRPPHEQERELLGKYLSDRGDRRDAACEQLVWALLTSGELRFNY